MRKIVSIIGARPQFIKHEPLKHFIEKSFKEITIHTGQHYDKNMSDVFFNEMDIKKPEYNINVGSGSHSTQTNKMMIGIEEILLKEEPDMVIVYGDTNSTLAGAITAKKLKMRLSHIEAGMRSFNMRMPEEINRIITDRLSDINFVPSKLALDNLKNEGMNGILCGDIMYDAFKYYSEKAEGNNLDNIMKGIKNNEYILMTLHRASNTIPENLEIILNRLNKIGKKIIFPIHPRTLKIIKNDLKGNNQFNNIELIEPVGYIDMITLMKNSLCIITDSGGLQKEAYYAEKKCFTVRGETEWPETMMYNANILCPNAECDFITEISNTDEIKFKNPYGDGNSAEIITKYLMEYLYDN